MGIGGHTVWPPGRKFGREDHLHLKKVKAYVQAEYPPPQGKGALKKGPRVPTAQTMCFWENFIKQELKKAPNLVGAGQVPDLTQVSGRRSKCKGVKIFAGTCAAALIQSH